MSSMESMEASDAQVGSLRANLLDAVQQKRQVLGEVSSSTEIVKGDADQTGEVRYGMAWYGMDAMMRWCGVRLRMFHP